MLDGQCSYTYYYHTTGTFSKTQKTRICHISLDAADSYNQNVILMVFTIRKQSGKWKIHSEGLKRTDPGATVPLRNKAIALAKANGWKYASIAIAGEDTPASEVIAQYVVSMESYFYGTTETVYDLTQELEKLKELNYPDFYRCEISASSNKYSFSFIKRHKLVDYLAIIDNRSYGDQNSTIVITDPTPDNLSTEELGQYLRRMYDDATDGSKVSSIHMFGLKYGHIIKSNNLSVAEIIRFSEINASYSAEVSKGIGIYKSIKDNEYGIRFYDPKDIESAGYSAESANLLDDGEPVAADEDVNGEKVRGGYNKIYYGAPGCGKSFLVNKILNEANVPERNRIRVTFHPEYANCDFVGQILPTIEKQTNPTTGEEENIVKYVFNPGPFTLALERARSTNDMVYLIIEEINRGNAAAIFGDLFQLLDREKDPTKANFGESEYPICNVHIQTHLGMGKTEKLVIPCNLTILATMNTSDQNVFTLDTAFKRRWSPEQISNNIEKDREHAYKKYFIPGTDVTWEKFLTVINREILKHKITSEDKRMGKYFVSKDCLTESVCDIGSVTAEAEMFAYKILEYIWNDVCKIGKDEWFDTSVFLTLEDLIDAFVYPQNGDSPLAVFKSITF